MKILWPAKCRVVVKLDTGTAVDWFVLAVAAHLVDEASEVIDVMKC